MMKSQQQSAAARAGLAPAGVGATARTRPAAAFTLLETVGVLAILAILAAVVAENVLTRMRNANRAAEGMSLTTLTGTLRTSIIQSKSLPAAANWAQAVASYLSLPINQVTATASGNPRLFLSDPNFQVGTNSALGLPYTQTQAGSLRPVSSRIVIVSSVGTALPPLANNTSSFSNIWNTLPNGVPAGWPSFWANNGPDLRIVRLDLGTLFHRVILQNLDLYNPAPYSIETTNTLTAVPTGGRQEMWFIHSTVINFHFNDNTLEAREPIVADVSYTYENGHWGRYVLYGPMSGTSSLSLSATWFGQMANSFLAAPAPPGSPNLYSDQQWVIDNMYSFLYDFGQWSLANFSGGPPWPHIPAYEQSSAAAGELSNASSDLISN